MDIVLLLTITVLSNIACFILGAQIGKIVMKDEPANKSAVNHMEAYTQSKQDKEAEEQKKRIDTIMRNIDNYDGTGNGQEDVR